MENRIQNHSISRKTILLLFLFVLLPSITVGSFVIYRVYVRNEETERKLTLQKLENRGQSIEDFMRSIETMGNDLATATSVADIVKNGKESTRFYECTSLIKDTIRYNDHIIKVQIIKDGKVIWNVGTGSRYVFDDSGNEEYASRIEEGDIFSFWSPAHVMYSLKNGTYSEEFWMTTYYQGIVDLSRMSVVGVLAIQVLEEDFCLVYQNILENTSVAAWIENKAGEVISATDKTFLGGGLPEELITSADYRSKGYRNGIRYQGGLVTAYRERCGNTDYYCVQVNRRESMKSEILQFVVQIGVLFLLFCLVFLLIYRKLVIHPLEDLSRRMERTRRMADNKQQQEYSSLQNAASHDEQGSEQGKEVMPGKGYLYNNGDEIQSLTGHFQEMLGEIDDLINKVYVEKIKSQQAEQQVLLEQINPHFLYNTLDSIHWNALRHGDRETGDQLEALSAMLRETLNLGHKHTTVERELSVVRNYCYLLETRFRKDIRVTIEEDSTVLQESIPKLILQPLIENAYRHGLENIIGHKQITVKIKKTGDFLAFYVADNGKGCNRAEILSKMEQDTGECFALKNIRDRLRLEYDGRAVFRFWSREGVGTIVKLMLPMKEEGSTGIVFSDKAVMKTDKQNRPVI